MTRLIEVVIWYRHRELFKKWKTMSSNVFKLCSEMCHWIWTPVQKRAFGTVLAVHFLYMQVSCSFELYLSSWNSYNANPISWYNPGPCQWSAFTTWATLCIWANNSLSKQNTTGTGMNWNGGACCALCIIGVLCRLRVVGSCFQQLGYHLDSDIIRTVQHTYGVQDPWDPHESL